MKGGHYFNRCPLNGGSTVLWKYKITKANYDDKNKLVETLQKKWTLQL